MNIGTTVAGAVTIGRAATTTTIQGSTKVTPQASASTTLLCTNAGVISTCDAAVLAPTATNFIQNQTASTQTAGFKIDGTGTAGTLVGTTAVQAPLFDTASAVALNIGTTNATQINLNKNVSIAANQNITFAAGTGSFDQSASSGTFATGTGAVSLNGDTTVASGKNLTVTSGTTALTGTTNINTSGAAVTSIGTGTGNNSVGNTTGTLGLTGSTVTVAGNTSINTTGTNTTTIGSVTAGAVSITSNAASNFTTNTGALTLTSAAATTWSTTAGALTLQGAAGATIKSAAGTTSSDVTVSTGNASAGASGNITIDTGTYTSGTPTVNIGTTVAGAVTIGRAATTTTIQGSTKVTPQASASTTLLCTNAGVISTCDAAVLTPTATNFIQNQTASTQTAGFKIDGTGTAGTLVGTTAVQAPLFDTASAIALNIGTTNATSININQNTVLAADKSIVITGGATRPASPVEGMVFYDTATKQLLTYANGKWQADGKEAIIVAASDSSDADKASADYVGDGNTAAAADGDQVQINAALTAADPAGSGEDWQGRPARWYLHPRRKRIYS
ncbi:hypothetical protein IPL85_03310 [Candidatus Saccharibacteria bacterium]|nr:MAG: hypothetical protein IPL85_03310 [Candidatus Saccharibacteria bacterium]